MNLNNLLSAENFNFESNEINITEDGNRIITKNRSTLKTQDGLLIIANSFDLDRSQNILVAIGNVEVLDQINNYKIYSNTITYFKTTEKIFSKDKTIFEIRSGYFINSNDVFFDRNKNIIESKKKTTIKDTINSNYYELDKFELNINNEILKGNNVSIISQINPEFNDKFYFESGIFNLKEKNFSALNPKILVKKDIFNNNRNDPRLYGRSAKGKEEIITLNKASFTSCEISDNCTPWHIEADEIIHDKNKKQIAYNNAKIKIFDFPVLYFPRFFHPDPSVERQSGFLQPEFNNSTTLGSSFGIPYFHIISKDKDLTLKSTIFENEIEMIQKEYRQKNKNSSLILDLAHVNGYKSILSNNKNSLNHFFLEYQANLNFKNFNESDLFFNLEKTSNDTYLKIFDSNISKNKSTPDNLNVLNSKIELKLKDDSSVFTAGFKSFEDLQLDKNDRYQYILPYYDYGKNINTDNEIGYLDFSSTGSNELKDTNNLKTKIINDLVFSSNDYFTKNGFKNNFNILTKNLNTIGKNDSNYKSSPQVEIMSQIELTSNIPLVKYNNNSIDYMTPKISMRLNPGDMKNYNSAERSVNVDSIFNLNRLGIDDSLEKGKSLTLGLDYKKENLANINNFFEMKFATVFRDKKEDFIPNQSSLGDKQSNIFGFLKYQYNDIVSLDYNYASDNNLDKLLYNSVNFNLNSDSFETKFSFIEKNGSFGSVNTIENSSKIKFDDKNSIIFNTRRNREINLTEYYNFVYEYENDCLTAGIKYSKNYYQDRDLKPTENLLFTVTLFPLTTFEQKVNK